MPVLLSAEQLCRPELLAADVPGGEGPVLAAGNGLQFLSRMPPQIQNSFENSYPLLLPRSRYIAKIASQMWQRNEIMAPDNIEPVNIHAGITKILSIVIVTTNEAKIFWPRNNFTKLL